MAPTTDQPIDVDAVVRQAYEFYCSNPGAHLATDAAYAPFVDMTAEELLQVNLAFEAAFGTRTWRAQMGKESALDTTGLLRESAADYVLCCLQQPDHPALRLVLERSAASRTRDEPAA